MMCDRGDFDGHQKHRPYTEVWNVVGVDGNTLRICDDCFNTLVEFIIDINEIVKSMAQLEQAG